MGREMCTHRVWFDLSIKDLVPFTEAGYIWGGTASGGKGSGRWELGGNVQVVLHELVLPSGVGSVNHGREPSSVWTQFTVQTGKRSEPPRGMPLVTRMFASSEHAWDPMASSSVNSCRKTRTVPATRAKLVSCHFSLGWLLVDEASGTDSSHPH
jgi:hypothetical protein